MARPAGKQASVPSARAAARGRISIDATANISRKDEAAAKKTGAKNRPRTSTARTRLRSPAPLHVDPAAPHIDGEPFLRAEQCIALLQRRLLKPLSSGGPRGDLTLTQYHALSFLASRGHANVCEIKDILGVAQSTTSVLVDKLARLGLVEKQRDRRDHRLTCVVPLSKGLRLVQSYRKNAERNLLALGAILGEGAVRDLFVALERALVATAPLEDPLVTRLADIEADEEDFNVDDTADHPGLTAAE